MNIFRSASIRVEFEDGRIVANEVEEAGSTFNPEAAFRNWYEPQGLEPGIWGDDGEELDLLQSDGSLQPAIETVNGYKAAVGGRMASFPFAPVAYPYALAIAGQVRSNPATTNQVLVGLHDNNGVYLAYNEANHKLVLFAGSNFECQLQPGETDFRALFVATAPNNAAAWINGRFYAGEAGGNQVNQLGIGLHVGEWGLSKCAVSEWGFLTGEFPDIMDELDLYFTAKYAGRIP